MRVAGGADLLGQLALQLGAALACCIGLFGCVLGGRLVHKRGASAFGETGTPLTQKA